MWMCSWFCDRPSLGVDRKAHPVARQGPPGTLFDEITRAPCGREIVGRVGRQDRRTLDAGDAFGRDEEVLRRARDVFKYGVSVLLSAAEIDRPHGWDRCVAAGRNTAIVDDRPQRIGIGMRCTNDGARKRGNESRHNEQPAPAVETRVPSVAGAQGLWAFRA